VWTAGTTLLWVHVWLLIPATLLHSMAVRVSVVTQRSLAQLLRDEYQDRPLIHYGLFGTAYVSLMAHLIPQVCVCVCVCVCVRVLRLPHLITVVVNLWDPCAERAK
jgi:hypothetical protein